MDVLITYDVNTEDKAGARRLRHVAVICESFGQRVQKSVFECTVNEVQLEALVHALGAKIDPQRDSLRVYRLLGGRHRAVTVLGLDRYVDFQAPLIV